MKRKPRRTVDLSGVLPGLEADYPAPVAGGPRAVAIVVELAELEERARDLRRELAGLQSEAERHDREQVHEARRRRNPPRRETDAERTRRETKALMEPHREMMLRLSEDD